MLDDILQGLQYIPVPGFTNDTRIMEYLCFNKANVVVLSLETLLSIYSFSAVITFLDNYEQLSQNTLLVSGLGISLYTLLRIAGCITALPLEGAESTAF